MQKNERKDMNIKNIPAPNWYSAIISTRLITVYYQIIPIIEYVKENTPRKVPLTLQGHPYRMSKQANKKQLPSPEPIKKDKNKTKQKGVLQISLIFGQSKLNTLV
ncbi:hypothetical protein TTHERM_01019560 (macronuclear) [Tetrahymena thermophila SB210]|uniref:Uncharacterized protein n=1 Tax=Tetrahymena thermophila (strain SB210) TaxID=312017 RepID=Q24C15_TETTS|nr:hypothetical protein TTHERM_01019560 [Tetrahymena thermophila SB210]EAS05287.1 hypothetical protein TTHERM_01019560 [Tetrahymena thermophila SB210]|eukprot:XP_001025532.1 hypothetical protein TTHERM_01019560 [Tetrahymena thermophila SB210]